MDNPQQQDLTEEQYAALLEQQIAEKDAELKSLKGIKAVLNNPKKKAMHERAYDKKSIEHILSNPGIGVYLAKYGRIFIAYELTADGKAQITARFPKTDEQKAILKRRKATKKEPEPVKIASKAKKTKSQQTKE